MATLTASRALAPVGTAGKLFAFGLDVGRGLFRRPFQMREFLQQAWFIASVTIIPTALVAIPFGAVIALQVGGLIKQFGAQSFTGSAAVLAVIREELDAMMVLGIDPIQRLVVPRVLACMLVATLLNGLVSVVGVAGGYFFNVILQGGTPGAYLASFSALAQVADFWSGEIKALIFGLIAAIVAAYKGLRAGGGPKGVGDAVNQSVVITFLLLFAVNFVITAMKPAMIRVVTRNGSDGTPMTSSASISSLIRMAPIWAVNPQPTVADSARPATSGAISRVLK